MSFHRFLSVTALFFCLYSPWSFAGSCAALFSSEGSSVQARPFAEAAYQSGSLADYLRAHDSMGSASRRSGVGEDVFDFAGYMAREALVGAARDLLAARNDHIARTISEMAKTGASKRAIEIKIDQTMMALEAYLEMGKPQLAFNLVTVEVTKGRTACLEIREARRKLEQLGSEYLRSERRQTELLREIETQERLLRENELILGRNYAVYHRVLKRIAYLERISKKKDVVSVAFKDALREFREIVRSVTEGKAFDVLFGENPVLDAQAVREIYLGSGRAQVEKERTAFEAQKASTKLAWRLAVGERIYRGASKVAGSGKVSNPAAKYIGNKILWITQLIYRKYLRFEHIPRIAQYLSQAENLGVAGRFRLFSSEALGDNLSGGPLLIYTFARWSDPIATRNWKAFKRYAQERIREFEEAAEGAPREKVRKQRARELSIEKVQQMFELMELAEVEAASIGYLSVIVKRNKIVRNVKILTAVASIAVTYAIYFDEVNGTFRGLFDPQRAAEELIRDVDSVTPDIPVDIPISNQ